MLAANAGTYEDEYISLHIRCNQCYRPQVRCIPRDANDLFLVLACDGVWDVMTSQSAAEYINKSVSDNGFANVPTSEKLTMTCYGLLLECLKRGSEDNMTALVIPTYPNANAVNLSERQCLDNSQVRRQLW